MPLLYVMRDASKDLGDSRATAGITSYEKHW